MKIVKDCKEILFVYAIQILLVVVFSFICTLLNIDVIKAMNDYFYYIVIVFYILLIIYFYKTNRIKDNVVQRNVYFIFVYFVLSVSIFLNMLFFYFNVNKEVSDGVSIFLLIISSGLLGPIVEEYLFRKILLNRLLKRYSIKKAIIVESFIFSLFHTSINGFIYAFIIGMLLSIVYVKYKNIRLVILCHMISNIFVLFLSCYNFNILLLSFLCLIISLLIIYKCKISSIININNN